MHLKNTSKLVYTVPLLF